MFKARQLEETALPSLAAQQIGCPDRRHPVVTSEYTVQSARSSRGGNQNEQGQAFSSAERVTMDVGL